MATYTGVQFFRGHGVDALLQFASFTILLPKYRPKYDFWRDLGGLKKFSTLAIARHILWPLIN